MDNKIFNELEMTLRNCSKYLDENNELLKSKVQSDALNMNEELLSLLLKNDDLKNAFFKDINGTLIFDKVSFSWTINSSKFLPNSYTSFKNKIGLLDEKGNYVRNSEDVTLAFPYKDCILEFDSTDEKEDREEIYLNETLCKNDIDSMFEAKIFTNPQKHTPDGINTIDKFNNENLIIKGNNLISLHALLPRYENKIKLMYWDILYNTNSDNVPYNDSFKHSSWLVMMKNRLEVAKKLLSEEGVLCLQCDDIEQAYLTVLADEIFGRENRNTCVIEMASTGGLKRSHKDKKFLKTKEYILIYKKNSNRNINCLYDEWTTYDGNYTIFFDEKTGIKSVSEEIEKMNPLYKKLKPIQYLGYNDIYDFLVKNKDKIFRRHGPSSWAIANLSQGVVVWKDDTRKTRNEVLKVYNETHTEFEYLMKINSTNKESSYERLEPLSWNYFDGKFKLLRGDLWKDYYKDMGNVSKEGEVKLSNGKKPERLIKDLLLAFTNENDLVLDAYFGTGTTGAVSLKMNRKFIGLEQLESHFEKSIQRITNVISGDKTGISTFANWQGGGEFISCELLKENELWIELINKANADNINAIYDEILNNPFVVNYKIDINFMQTAEIKEEFNKLSFEEKKKVLISIIDKNNLYVNYFNRDDKQLDISETDIKFTKSFYGEK